MSNQNYSDCVQKAIVVRYNGTTSVSPPCCGAGAISCTQNIIVTVEDYVKSTLPNEWIPSYHIESLKAGAVAIRSYALYRMLYYPYSTNNYHAIAGTCFQSYGSQQSNTTNAVNSTTGKIMTRPDGNVAFTEYSSENNNVSSQCSGSGNSTNPGYGDGYVANCSGSYTQGPTSGIPDLVSIGRIRAGHGKGISQRGSQSWASGIYTSTWCGFLPGYSSNVGQSTGQGQKSYTWILQHYYPSFTLTTVPICGFGTCTGISSLSCTSPQTLTNQTTVGNPNNFVLYNNTGCSGWNMSGPEKVYKISPTSSGTLSVLTSSVSNSNLRVFIVKANSCSALSPSTSGQVLAYGTSSTSTVSCSVSAGQLYFIVVDGKQVSGSTVGQSGTFTIKVTTPCIAPPVRLGNQDFETQDISWLSLDPENGWTATVSSGEVITITNMLGQVITTLESREDGEIWLPKLPSGMYVVSICCDNQKREKVGKILY